MTDATSKRDAAYQWQIDVSLLGQPTMLANFAKIIFIAGGVMGGLLVFLSLAMDGRRAPILPLLELTGVAIGIVAVLMLLVIVLFFRNRMTMAYRLDAKSAYSYMIDRRARAGANAALIVGALSGNAQVFGAGLIAKSTASQSVNWAGVRKVTASPRRRTIRLANAWRTVMILFCNEDNYANVARYVDERVRASPHLWRPNPLPGLLLRSALTVVACLPMYGLPNEVAVEGLAPLLVMCFALVSVWLFPIFGWVVIAGLGWVFVEAAANGATSYTSQIDGRTMSQFELMLDSDWIGVGVAFAGAAYLIGQSLALLRGRFDSALAGDMLEGETPSKPAPAAQASPPPLPKPAPAPPKPRFCSECGGKLDAEGRCPSCAGGGPDGRAPESGSGDFGS